MKRVVVTGASSGGKTTILEELKKRGYCVGEEVSRMLIKELKEQGREELLPKNNRDRFERLLLMRKVEEYLLGSLNCNSPYDIQFFDRGLPDAIGFYRADGLEPPQEIIQACKRYKYDAVFLVPPWQEIYTTDDERKEDFGRAVKVYEQIKLAYTELGYDPIEIPKVSVEARLKFVKSNLEELYPLTIYEKSI
jgi:predicted ATPase